MMRFSAIVILAATFNGHVVAIDVLRVDLSSLRDKRTFLRFVRIAITFGFSVIIVPE